jgi:hypothetical protein
VRLVETLLACKGAVVLSGYDHPVYAPLEEAGWTATRYETACYASGRVRGSGLQGKGAALAKAPRVEVVWTNPRAMEMLDEQKGEMQWKPTSNANCAASGEAAPIGQALC